MRRLFLLVPLLIAGCGDDDGRVPRDAPPAAAVLTPGMEMAGLDDQLADLGRELERALAGEPERLLPAEAITDRLIQAPRRVDWLAAGYDVEARLRQLQAMADRVVARLRRGAPLEEVAGDVETMRASVLDLQEQLAGPGGGPAPPTLDSLLAQDPLRDVSSPIGRMGADEEADDDPIGAVEPTVSPVGSGPLGTPVRGRPDTTGGRR